MLSKFYDQKYFALDRKFIWIPFALVAFNPHFWVSVLNNVSAITYC